MDSTNSEDSVSRRLNEKWGLLDGKQLSAFRGSRNMEIPQRGGSKEYAPDGSWLQNKRLEKVREERREVLTEPKVERKGGLSTGYWCPELRKIQIIYSKGKCWSHFGHYEKGTLYLFPEEAVYLMDTGSLEVYYGGVALSVEQAYTSFLMKSDINLSEYQVYAHLCRLGFIVLRHDKDCDITLYERQLKLDQHFAKIHKKRKHQTNEQDVIQIKELTKGEKSNAAECQKGKKIRKLEEINILSQTRNKLKDVEEDRDQVHKISSCSKWNFKEIHFPDLGEISNGTVLEIAHKHLLPKSIQSADDTIAYHFTNCNKTFQVISSEPDFSNQYDSRWKIPGTQASNWNELKSQLQKKDTIHVNPVSHLWQDDIVPLVRPEDAKSTGAVLKKLQIFKNTDIIKTNKLLPVLGQPELKFDVYPPDSKFKKSNPGLPSYRICVMSYNDPPPDLAMIIALTRRIKDEVPVLWAVEDNGDIAFFCFHDVSIPVEITMG